MNKTSNGLFWGTVMLAFGLALLGKTLGWFHINWGGILYLWPILLILAGVCLLARRSWSTTASAILIAIAVPTAIANGVHNKYDDFHDDWNFNWDDDDHRHRHNDNDDDNNSNEYSERENKYDADGTNGHFSEAFPVGGLNEATLNFGAGAGEFTIEGTTSQLLEADTESELGGYVLTNKRNDATKSSVLKFHMEGDSNHVDIKDLDDVDNKVNLKLNDKPDWTIELGLGAGKGNFDFSDYKVKRLKLETGVSDVDLKLGDKSTLTEVDISSGVASIDIEVPESAGCEFRVEGALNAKDFDDFEKVSDGLYRTANYEKSSKKINIKYEGGLSTLKVSRY